jgi:hypothetical protein
MRRLWHPNAGQKRLLCDFATKIGLIMFGVVILWLMFPQGLIIGSLHLQADWKRGVVALILGLMCMGLGYWFAA